MIDTKRLLKIQEDLRALLLESTISEYMFIMEKELSRSVKDIGLYFLKVTSIPTDKMWGVNQKLAMRSFGQIEAAKFQEYAKEILEQASRDKDVSPTAYAALNHKTMKLFTRMEMATGSTEDMVSDVGISEHDTNTSAEEDAYRKGAEAAQLTAKGVIKKKVKDMNLKIKKLGSSLKAKLKTDIKDVRDTYMNFIINGAIVIAITLIIYSIYRKMKPIKVAIKNATKSVIKKDGNIIENILDIILAPFKAMYKYFQELGPIFSLSIMIGLSMIIYGMVMLYHKMVNVGKDVSLPQIEVPEV